PAPPPIAHHHPSTFSFRLRGELDLLRTPRVDLRVLPMRQRRRTLRGASSRLVRLVRDRLDRLLADLALPYLITVAVLRTHLFSPCILYSVTKTGENWSRQPIGLPRSRPFSRRHFWLDSSRFHFQIMK